MKLGCSGKFKPSYSIKLQIETLILSLSVHVDSWNQLLC